MVMTTAKLQEFEHFHWGVYSPGCVVYGLYEPVMDLFLLLVDSAEQAETLKYLLSPRYALHIYRVDTAVNFKDIGLDNLCCHNWSFTNKNQLLSIRHGLTDQDIVPIEELCPTTNTKVWDIDQEKSWIMWCNYVLTRLEQYPGLQYKKMFRTMGAFFDVDEFKNTASLVRSHDEILTILYRGTDIEQTRQKILDILSRYSLQDLI